MSNVVMRPPAGVSGTLQGRALNFSPDASGNYNVSDYRDVNALLQAGWRTVVSGTESTPDYVVDLTGIAPAAALNTYGAAVLLTPTADFGSVKPLSCDLIFGGTFGSETLTVKIIVIWSDGSTATVTSFTATSTGTTVMTPAQLRTTFFKNGLTISSISFQAASSLAAGSSIATLEVKSHGEQS